MVVSVLMIRSKKGKVVAQKKNTQNVSNDLKFMAYVRNYQCLFCTKKVFLKSFEDIKCDSCGSQWFLKLQDKKVKTVDAV